MIALRIAERDPGLAAVGYWLRPEARGRGAATVAVQVIARRALDELGVQRLERTTAPENLASHDVQGSAVDQRDVGDRESALDVRDRVAGCAVHARQ